MDPNLVFMNSLEGVSEIQELFCVHIGGHKTGKEWSVKARQPSW